MQLDRNLELEFEDLLPLPKMIARTVEMQKPGFELDAARTERNSEAMVLAGAESVLRMLELEAAG